MEREQLYTGPERRQTSNVRFKFTQFEMHLLTVIGIVAFGIMSWAGVLLTDIPPELALLRERTEVTSKQIELLQTNVSAIATETAKQNETYQQTTMRFVENFVGLERRIERLEDKMLGGSWSATVKEDGDQ